MTGNITLSRKPEKGEDGYKIFSVRVKEETITALGNIADLTGRSRNEIVNIFLEYGIKNYMVTDE